MANSFTNILPILTEAAQTVSRESVGMLRAVNLSGSTDGVNLGATINLPKAPAQTASDWSPSLAPTLADTTATGLQMTLSLAKKSDFHVTAEQQAAMDKGSANALTWFKGQAAQSMRVLSNTIELYLWTLAYQAASRAVGTAGTTPFASALTLASSVAQILDENGAPRQGRSLVLNPAAYANARALFANVASTQAPSTFQQGELPEISGLMPYLSNQVGLHTKGTNSGATTNNAGYAIGDTTLTLASAGTGTIVAGDVITLATENAGHNFVVRTGDADVSGGGTVVLNDPGLRAAIAAATRAITTGNSYTANLALSRDAIYAAVRAPLQPDGNIVGQQEIVMDDVSGIPFGVYRQFGDGVVHYSVRVIYGATVMERAHIATLMG